MSNSPHFAVVERTNRLKREPIIDNSGFSKLRDKFSNPEFRITIHKRLMRYRQRANVHLTAHRLRHSFANDLLSAGAPVTSIQQLLGHRWLETTQIYVTANDQQVQADYYAACSKLEGWS
jgi:integrase/recombinase XerC